MSVNIPFPIPNHGYALNSKLRVNLDYIVQQFNQFNTGTATWDTVAIGVANSETGTLSFYNSGNANYLTLQAGATSPSTTFTLPTAVPSATRKFLNSTTGGVMGWSTLSDLSSYTGNQLLYADGSGVIHEVSVGSGNKILVNSTPPSFFSLLGTTNEIVVTANAGDFTLSTPQAIATSSNVTFNSVQTDGGTATNPGVRVIFSGASTNTGLFSSSGTSLSVTVAGTSRGTFDNAGDLTMTSSLHAPAIRATTSYALSTGASGIITIQANSSTGGTYTLTLPVDDGNSNQVLTTDGSGVLSWADASATTGIVNSGVAGRLTLYPGTGTTVDDIWVQNTKNIDIAIAAQASRSANIEYTIPNPGNAVTTAKFLLDADTGSYTIAGTWTITNDLTESGRVIINGNSSGQAISINQAVAGNLLILLQNTSSNSAAYAYSHYSVTSATAGDPYIRFQTDATDWSIGCDNSTSDSFKVSKSTTLGTNDYLTIPASGTIILGLDFDCQRSSAAGTVSGQIENTDNTDAASGAKLVINPGGTSAGDGWVEFHIPSGSDWSVGSDNSDSDKFKVSQAATIGTSDALVISTSGPAVSIHGSITNDSASAGFVGEYVSASASNVSFPTTGQFGDLASISLTAGDWDISATMAITKNGATVNVVLIGISTTSGNSATGLTYGDNELEVLSPTAAGDNSAVIPAYRLSLSGSATAYLKYYAEFTVATPKAYGRISARRVR